MKRLFGTDGMRGEAGVFPLDAQTMTNAGSSLAIHLQEKVGRKPTILIGRDTRESGEWLEQALKKGALSAGAECLSAGVITTPGVAFLARTLPADAGVVISASHNPYHDNGIKIFAPSGQKLDNETERLIERDIHAKSGSANPGDTFTNSHLSHTPSELQNRYVHFLVNDVGKDLLLQGLKLVVDCANGAASDLAPGIFERLGAEVVAINNSPDGRNINKDCGSLHIEKLRERVVYENANIGIAYDGDADRSLFVDNEGKFVDGDATLWVLAKYFQEHNKLALPKVVATVMSNIGLEIALRSRGIELVRADVGDKYVLDQLLSSGASLGGEQSGHIIIPKVSLAGDGIITSLYLLRAMTEKGKSLAALTTGLEHYPQVLVNVRVREKVAFNDVPSISEAKTMVENKLGSTGRLLLRYSGTEPLARIMIEGQHQNEIEGYAQEIASAIRQELG